MKTADNRNYLSDEGKLFIHKVTNDIMGWGICLGNNDSIDNYEEVDCPDEYKGNKDYDNTVKEEVKISKLDKNHNIKK